MSQITFSKSAYHLQNEIADWCNTHVGKGGWTSSSPVVWDGMEGKVWVMHAMFGNITYCFKDDKHYTMFILRWAEKEYML